VDSPDIILLLSISIIVYKLKSIVAHNTYIVNFILPERC
jgi:hypothetical protein